VVQTVLTATINSYGNWQISTPHKIDTPGPIDKNCAQLIIRGPPIPNSVQINPLRASGKIGEIYVAKIIFNVFTCTFFSVSPAGQTRGWIFTRDSSKDVKSCKDVSFWGYKTLLILSPSLFQKIVKMWP